MRHFRLCTVFDWDFVPIVQAIIFGATAPTNAFESAAVEGKINHFGET